MTLFRNHPFRLQQSLHSMLQILTQGQLQRENQRIWWRNLNHSLYDRSDFFGFSVLFCFVKSMFMSMSISYSFFWCNVFCSVLFCLVMSWTIYPIQAYRILSYCILSSYSVERSIIFISFHCVLHLFLREIVISLCLRHPHDFQFCIFKSMHYLSSSFVPDPSLVTLPLPSFYNANDRRKLLDCAKLVLTVICPVGE